MPPEWEEHMQKEGSFTTEQLFLVPYVCSYVYVDVRAVHAGVRAHMQMRVEARGVCEESFLRHG